ncbi:MAG: cyclopropane-fatty-acyl-phospholipid synthase family protein [Pseudomonadota bacterium]
MTVNTLTASSIDQNASRSWFARQCRELLKRKLMTIQDGRLDVTDPWGEWSAGEPGPLDATLRVRDGGFYVDAVSEGSLGVADAWIGGRWDTDDLTMLLRLMVRNMSAVDQLEGGMATIANGLASVRHWFNRNSKTGSTRNIHAHYDLGNDLFEQFLDNSMTYSSAVYAEDEFSLDQAQFEKLDRICRKLRLSPADHVLEIGTGWGSFAMHAARHYGARVTTTTISREQFELAEGRVRKAGLQDRIDILLSDYRDLNGHYDKLVSIEMIEAVGHAYLPEYFATCARRLKPDGAMLLQAITMPDQRYSRYLKSADFIQTTVFPGSCCPALTAILGAVRDHTDFRVGHLEDIGPHYARTLREWRERFEERSAQVSELGYDAAFQRMWRYYLAYCEAGFEERYTGTVQLLLDKPGRRVTPVLGRFEHPASATD